MKRQNLILLLILAIGLGLSPQTRAVVPAPDGGYPGGNTAEGQNALFSLASGSFNTAVGYFSLRSDTAGSYNTGVGAGTLLTNANGSSNTALGTVAGLNITGSGNICIGSGVVGVAGENNTIRIGDNLLTNSACYIGGLLGPSPLLTVRWDQNTGQLGTNASSQRFKRDIKPMDKASEAIMALKPVTFHYKGDAKNILCFGLIAEEVEKINPDLVVRDKDGKPYSIVYDHVNAMLLNEFLKEHKRVEEQKGKLDDQARKIQEQEATIAELKKEMRLVIADLKAQDSKIEKVSALVGTSKADRVVASTP